MGTGSITEAPELFEYGIQTEASDIRAHVSVCNKTLYVFPTKNGVRAISENQCKIGNAGQPGVDGVTGRGWLVKHEWIEDLRKLRYESWAWHRFLPMLSTEAKGKLAVECVTDSMKAGRVSFWIDARETDRENVQVSGTDIVVFCRKRIQVKCDWSAGKTGNLFLQCAERNPLKRH